MQREEGSADYALDVRCITKIVFSVGLHLILRATKEQITTYLAKGLDF